MDATFVEKVGGRAPPGRPAGADRRRRRVPIGGAPPGVIDEERRLELRAQVEAVVARDVFGLSRGQLEYVLETFPIVKRRDIERYGEYRTKALILRHCET